MNERSYYNAAAASFVLTSADEILGTLTKRSSFSIDPQQKRAWLWIIAHLKTVLARIPQAHVFLEFVIPRMGRRVDAIILYRGLVFVLEYKVGEPLSQAAPSIKP
jgi:hypothetical protein